MKMKRIEVRNYRSLRDIQIQPKDVLALIGRNNSGKSNVIKALEILFEGSVRLIDKECFCGHKMECPIEIFVTFEKLSEWEKEQFKPWMDRNELVVGREVVCTGADSYEINTIAVIRVPEHEWLQDEAVGSHKINEWWLKKDTLKIGNLNFGEKLGTSKPSVAKWKGSDLPVLGRS